jgi:hypothetical protein
MAGGGTSYSYTLDTRTLTNGAHSIHAGAVFGGAAVASATDTVTMSNFSKYGSNAQSVITLNGTTIIYELGTDGHLYENYNSGSGWSGKQSIANQPLTFVSAPSVTVLPSGQTDMHVVGSDGNIWENYAPAGGNWAGWTPLSTATAPVGGFIQSPVTRQASDGTFLVYAVGANGNMWEDYDNASGWSGWQPFANPPAGERQLGASVWGTLSGQVRSHRLGDYGLRGSRLINAAGEHTIVELAELFSVSRPTVYRVLERSRREPGGRDA